MYPEGKLKTRQSPCRMKREDVRDLNWSMDRIPRENRHPRGEAVSTRRFYRWPQSARWLLSATHAGRPAAGGVGPSLALAASIDGLDAGSTQGTTGETNPIARAERRSHARQHRWSTLGGQRCGRNNCHFICLEAAKKNGESPVLRLQRARCELYFRWFPTETSFPFSTLRPESWEPGARTCAGFPFFNNDPAAPGPLLTSLPYITSDRAAHRARHRQVAHLLLLSSLGHGKPIRVKTLICAAT